MKFLVTGAAGFIGCFVALRLLDAGHQVIGLDNLNDYYDVNLKLARLKLLEDKPGFEFIKLDLADRSGMAELFAAYKFDRVIHLAAQAGVRYSLENPLAYADSNLIGFVNILEGCRHNKVGHLLYASSSSVYGLNKKQPFSTEDSVDHPISLYAATKKANELMAHSYSRLYGLPATGLRFFTVYGPWGRPDMAIYLFTEAILAGRPIDVFNHGLMARDFTYIDDIASGTVAALDRPPTAGPDGVRHAVYNLGNHRSEKLMDLIHHLETLLGRKAEMRMLPMQPGDVVETFADIDASQRALGFNPATSIVDGLARFVAWYKEYHRVR